MSVSTEIKPLLPTSSDEVLLGRIIGRPTISKKRSGNHIDSQNVSILKITGRTWKGNIK